MRIIIALLVMSLGLPAHAQIFPGDRVGMIRGSSREPLAVIKIFRSYKSWTKENGQTDGDGMVRYELWLDNNFQKHLGGRNGGWYFDRELIHQKNKLNAKANTLAAIDIGVAAVIACAATGCIATIAGALGGGAAAGAVATGTASASGAVGAAEATTLAVTALSVASKTGPWLDAINRHSKAFFGFLSASTAVAFVGGVAGSFMQTATKEIMPFYRWEMAKGLTIVWEVEDPSGRKIINNHYIHDVRALADSIDEGLNLIDQRIRKQVRRNKR